VFCTSDVYSLLQNLVGIIALGDVLNGLLSRLDLIGILVGDLNGELLLNSHDNLDGIQGVQAEVSVEAGLKGDLFDFRVDM
jgi:hypothetical protein